ncbi:MAG: hypothetical protein [Bacteriophage sp.]|nr:MAG: hypothetical protein [Bacteriophage sp.]
MNLRTHILIVALGVVGCWLLAKNIYSNGWKEGRAALVAEQQAKAQAQLAKQTTRQQANDSKAAAADDEGKAKTVTITQEVIRYVKTPGRNVCTFDTDRLSIKSAAVDNANTIPGYDDTAVQAPAAVGQR